MTLDWQTMLTLAIVATAGAYVARLGWRAMHARRVAACGGGCKGCAAGGEPEMTAIGSSRVESNGAPIED